MVFGFFKEKSNQEKLGTTTAIDDEPVIEPPILEKKPGFQTTEGATAVVTGSSGLCGARLAEILLERGAACVILMDICTPNATLQARFLEAETKCNGKFIHFNGSDGDLTNPDAIDKVFSSVPKIDVVYHIAALVGPFHDAPMYYKVNVLGTKMILDACKKYNVPKLVNASSPSTRFHGGDIEGQREDELDFPKTYVAIYAETKAEAERLVTAATCEELRTVSVGPHQIYGPHDSLFLPAFLSTMGNQRLRIFGKGDKLMSVCYVDNYCHGLICGADEIENPNSPALGKFYIITDTKPVNLWDIINDAGMQMGFSDLKKKIHLPLLLLYFIAYLCAGYTYITNKKTKLNPFTVRMMTIHRYFSPELSRRDLKYEPLYTFEEAWVMTKDWFQKNWLPKFCEETGRTFHANQKTEKMD
jgi:nucleoside-diphosphate-sugar epimerase